LTFVVFAAVLACGAGLARAQTPPDDDEHLQILSDPESVKKKIDKGKARDPFEFFRSTVAPFDVLPFVKANHWATISLELRANTEDYEGFLQSMPVRLQGMAHELVFRRESRLLKEQRARLALQMVMPEVPKEWRIDMAHPDALRPDSSWQASLSTLPPHQMLVVILSKEGTNQFANWSRLTATIPGSTDRSATPDIDKERYYRLVLPIEPDHPQLSAHPLTWTTISHVIWDEQAPDVLSVSQQEALVDWLHWGGQLILTGGAGQSFSLFRESFLGPYLPADATGETISLAEADLKPLADSYPPPSRPSNPDDQAEPVPLTRAETVERHGKLYQPAEPIHPGPNRPVMLSALAPRPGAATIPLGEASPHVMAVERRVGRGRVTMLTINPNDPALQAWPGLDTLVRRVILRRPEEPVISAGGTDGYRVYRPKRGRLRSWDLSWYRITSRDAGSIGENPDVVAAASRAPGSSQQGQTGTPSSGINAALDAQSTSDWRDDTRIPRLARDLLEQASGISIPSSRFVLQIILAYLLAVVPLNWLICRVGFRRREWAWFLVPLIAIGFAVSVERVAARDLGYETASDEIDLLEMQSAYPRAHLTRLGSLYTAGRSQFSITYPNDPTALALPLDSGRSIRGEEVSVSAFQSYPVPGLLGLAVQPRSLSLFRAEEMLSLAGSIRLEGDTGKGRIVNDSELELRDAILIDVGRDDDHHERYLGTIKPGGELEIGEDDLPIPARFDAGPGPDATPFLRELRTTWEAREENQGEIRLVAWVPGSIGGQAIEPAVDRRRGFTAVLVHLRQGNAPGPDGPRYNALAAGAPQPNFDFSGFVDPNEPPTPSRFAPQKGAAGRRRAVPGPASKSIQRKKNPLPDSGPPNRE
jgi:hypothetical protein